jgi:uncharacterized membrane protein YhaH (DUF805 family)
MNTLMRPDSPSVQQKYLPSEQQSSTASQQDHGFIQIKPIQHESNISQNYVSQEINTQDQFSSSHSIQSNVIPSTHLNSIYVQIEEDYGLIDWFFKCIRRHYFDFSGRARRREFWSFILVGLIIGFFTTVTDSIFGIGAATYIVNGALLVPLFAVGTRRLHDIGLSGRWQLLYLSGVGIGLLILMWLLNSEKKMNDYGESPKTNQNKHIFS